MLCIITPNGKIWQHGIDANISGTVRVADYASITDHDELLKAIATAACGEDANLVNVQYVCLGNDLISFRADIEDIPDWIDPEMIADSQARDWHLLDTNSPEDRCTIINELMQQYGLEWCAAEHAIKVADQVYPRESVFTVHETGRELHFYCSATAGSDYVRTVIDGWEIHFQSLDQDGSLERTQDMQALMHGLLNPVAARACKGE